MSYLAKTPEGLLPCPHCGGEAEARDGSSTMPYIRCKSCGCRTGSSWNVDKLKAAWNRRAERICTDVEGGDFFRCSACGCEVMRVADGWKPLYMGEINYCPNWREGGGVDGDL